MLLVSVRPAVLAVRAGHEVLRMVAVGLLTLDGLGPNNESLCNTYTEGQSMSKFLSWEGVFG